MSFEFASSLYPTYRAAVSGALEVLAGGESLAGMSAAEILDELTDEGAWGEIVIKTPEGPRVVTVDDVDDILSDLAEIPF